MSIFEYDKEEEEKKLRQAEYEAGKEDGVKVAIETGIKNMLNTGKYSIEEIAEVFQVSIEDVKRMKNESEVIAMSIFEYDKEKEEKKLRQAEYEAGKEAAIRAGVKNMLEMEKYSVEEIAEVFQISIEEVEQIKRKSGC